MAAVSNVLLPLFALTAVVLVWAASVEIFKIPRYQLPAPGAVIDALTDKWPVLMGHAQHTGTAIVLGFVLSVAIGIPLAVAIAFSRTTSAVVYPIIVGTQAMPKSALAPLFVVWVGFGMQTEVLVSFLVAFFPVVVNTVLGLKLMPLELQYLARSMGAGQLRTFFKVRLPYAFPSIFSGLKVAMTLAVVGAIVGEFVGSNAGLGYYLLVASSSIQTDLVFAVLLVLAGLAISLFLIVQVAEAVFVPRSRNLSGYSGGG